MFRRHLQTSTASSFFLFGARGTGKTTLLLERFARDQCLYVDLLDPREEDIFSRDPSELRRRSDARPARQQWVIVDEVQRVPKLLDVVHQLIESSQRRFVLTGSSSRKLMRGASNLLAGRAFIYRLHPLTHRELESSFDLLDALQWGTLPKVYSFESSADKAEFLRAYALTYLREEIAQEQLVRKLDPFRQFLEVAAQMNGLIINYAAIARDVGVDSKTVESYFSVLEDTLMGILLPSYHRSVRKRQRSNHKFYFFDTGIRRSLERTLGLGLREGTYEFGRSFEHFVILEIMRLADYARKEWAFSYLRTKDDAEIDLVIDRPGQPKALVEIKSTARIQDADVRSLIRFAADMKPCEAFCLSRDPHEKRIGDVLCLPWIAGCERLGL